MSATRIGPVPLLAMSRWMCEVSHAVRDYQDGGLAAVLSPQQGEVVERKELDPGVDQHTSQRPDRDGAEHGGEQGSSGYSTPATTGMASVTPAPSTGPRHIVIWC